MRLKMTVPFLAALAACMNLSPGGERSTANVQIEQNAWQDNRTLPLEDLVWGTDRLFPEELNVRLDTTPLGEIRRSDTDLYALSASDGEPAVRDLRTLSNALSQRFGDDAFPAELNRLRTQQIEAGKTPYYGENAFLVRANLGPDLQVGVKGLGAEASTSVNVGLAGDSVEYRFVTAFDDPQLATTNPVGAIRARRGTALPTSLAQVQSAMLPGECVAIRGAGETGFNFGLDTRVLVENPLPGQEEVYGAILNGGLKVLVHSDHMDLQLCRMEGDQATIEIGLGDADVSSAHFAVMTGHGLRGLGSPSIHMGGTELDAETVLDRALRNELYRRIHTFAIGAEAGANGARESLARFRIDLGTRDPQVLAAVEQFLRGDLRLAQSLAQRQTSGIASELDVTRVGHTVYGGLGFGAFGMSFFQAFASQQTEFAVQAPGGSLRGLAKRFEHASGGFFSRHGYGRTVLSGVETPVDGTADAQTSLYLSWRDEDGYMERAKVQANLRASLIAIAGPQAFAPVAAALDAVAQATQTACPGREPSASCLDGVATSSAVTAKLDAARAAYGAALGRGGDASERQVADAAFELALASARTYEPPAALVGPPTTFTTDAWLSDAAVKDVMSHSGSDLAAMVAALEPGADADVLAEIAETFEAKRVRFNALTSIAETAIEGVGKLGFDVLTVRVPMNGARALYDEMVVKPLVEVRAESLSDTFDTLLDRVGDIRWLGDRSERTLGWALVGLSDSSLRDYAVNARSSLENRWTQSYDRYRAAGNLDGEVSWRHHGDAVRHFGAGIGWTIDGVMRLIDADAE